ncbi:MAG: tetratricopeptide repeat protein [Flavobacteriales bacterium]|nr:tetratricopeptide repeat protein [Flavobacteriales bacterium]
MKHGLKILLLFTLFLAQEQFGPNKAEAQVTSEQHADPSYYLIDSLNLSSFADEDKALLDSMLTIYHETEQDSTKIISINILAENLMHESWLDYNDLVNVLLTEQLNQGGLNAEETLLYKRLMAGTLNNFGFSHFNHGNVSEALKYFQQSLAIQNEINDLDGMASSLGNIGRIYDSQGNIAQALECYHQSLKIGEQTGDKYGIANCLISLGRLYNTQGEVEKAEQYFHKSLKLQEKIGDKRGAAQSLANLGFLHQNRNEITEARAYYERGLNLHEEIGNQKGVVYGLGHLATCDLMRGDTAKALEYYIKSLALSKEIGFKTGIAFSLENIGFVHFTQGEIEVAERHARQSMEISQELGYPKNIMKAASLLSKILKKQGRYKSALEHYELFITMRDSLKNEETQKATIRQQTKYEFEKALLVKEQEEKESMRIAADIRERRDNLQYSVVLIILVILGTALLVMGRFSIPIQIAEGLIFFSFLIFFEFLLVLTDPYIDFWSSGAPGLKLMFNALIAGIIFPLHSFFESKLKRTLVGEENER